MSYLKNLTLIATRSDTEFYLDKNCYVLHVVRRYSNKRKQDDIPIETQTFSIDPILITLLLEFIGLLKKSQEQNKDLKDFFSEISLSNYLIINENMSLMLKEYAKDDYPNKPIILDPDDYFNDNDLIGTVAQANNLKMLSFWKRKPNVKEFLLYNLGFSDAPALLVTYIDIVEPKDQHPFIISYNNISFDLHLAHTVLKRYFDKNRPKNSTN